MHLVSVERYNEMITPGNPPTVHIDGDVIVNVADLLAVRNRIGKGLGCH